MSSKVSKSTANFESENKFKSLFENSPTGIALIDIDGTIKEVNLVIISLLGSPSVEATKGINVLTFEPLVNVGFSDDFINCKKTGENISRLVYYVTKWKKGIYVQYTLSSILGSDGVISGVILNVIDVTSQKEAEKKEKKYFSDLEFITKSATEMLELKLSKDPLHFIGEKLKSLLGDNAIFINKYSAETKTSSIEYAFINEERKKEFNELLNKNIERLKFSKTPPPVHNYNYTKKLVELDPVDFFVNSCFFPEKESKKIIKLHNVNKVYFMGICPENNLLASVIIVTYNNEIIENKEVIETFINQASIVLQRQIALKNLSEAEHLYNNTLNSISELIHVVDINLNVIFANAALKNLYINLGFNSNIEGLSIKEAFPFLTDNTVENYNKILISKKPFFSEETSFINGRVFNTETIITPVIENEEVTRFITSVRDVTQNKLSELEIKALKELNESIIQNMNEGVLMEDERGVIVMVNPAFCKMVGKESETLIGKPVLSIIPKQLHNKIKFAKLNLLAYRENSFEIEFRNQLGSKITALHSFVPIFSENKLKNIVSVYTDISSRKILEYDLISAKEKIAESEEKFRTIFETANDGILVAEAETKKFIFANPQMCSLTGYSYNELTKLSIKDIHPSDELLIVQEKFERQLNKEIRIVENLPLLKKNGEIVYCDINSSPMEVGNKKYLLGFFRDITYRKIAELELLESKEKIEESEKKFRELYEKSGDAILIIKNGLFIDCNQATVTMLKYKNKEEFLNVHPSVLSPETQAEGISSMKKAEKMMSLALKNGTHRFEWNHKKADGVVFPVEVLLTAISDEKDNNVIHTVWRDISDRKRAEAELIKSKEKIEESENHLRNILELSNLSMAIIAFDGTIEFINQQAIKTFGYLHKDIPDMDCWWSLAYPDDEYRKQTMEQFMGLVNKAIIEKSEIERREYYPTCKDGTVKTMIIFGVIVDGKIFVMFEDITEQKRIIDALITSENRLQLISGFTSDYIFEFDVDESGKIEMTFVSENFHTVTGGTIDDIKTPERLFNILHPDDVFELLRLLKLIISTGSKEEMECRSFIKGKEMRWVSVSAKAKIDEKTKRVSSVVGTVKDITERKKAEEQIIKALKKAEESDKLKSAFLANMSHELRTPINGIVGFSNLLLKSDNTSEKKEKYVSQINASTSMLLRLIEDIIDIAKIESGSLTIEKSPCNPSKILNDLYLHYQQELKARNKENIQLIYKPYSDLSLTIVTDSFRLKQVLLNLLSNAVKFTKQGEIEYGFTLENNELLFYVRDTGIGIKQENIIIIFERFAQLELSLSRKFGGTGLGLTISKNIIEHLGGKIWVESELEKGSTFFFKIPAEIIQATEDVVANVIFNPIQYQWDKFTLLVAEDDDLNFMFIEEMLSETKVKLIRAKNGLEAIDLVKNNSEIELVLMDIQMPFMDGYESTKIILTIKPHLPIIAQTAFALASEKEMSFKVGCIDYISKPLDMEELLIKIKKYLPVKL